ncbi:hypothetical protein BDW22DRAFT_525200 [Trametopsis cervina]|nr:hypothetical protein BDW22DRAFT_525200 [Trametopsis cervina]
MASPRLSPHTGIPAKTNKTNDSLHDDAYADSTYAHLFDSIRSTLVKSSLGALFTPPRPVDGDLEAGRDTSLPTGDDNVRDDQGRIVSPSSTRRFTFFDDAKRIIKEISPTRLRTRSGSLNNGPTATCPSASRSRSRSIHYITSSFRASGSGSGFSDSNATPPLTPDSLSAQSLADSQTSLGTSPDLVQLHSRGVDPSTSGLDELGRSREESEVIRAGKQPERPICYEALIADISHNSPQSCEQEQETVASPVPTEDEEDWYGLEETIELSLRERKASDCYSPGGGESSRSYDSWEAMHHGYVHPLLMEREYRRWRKWHHNLDKKLQQRERILRTFQFLRDSKEKAEVYVSERKGRNRIQGNPENIKMLKHNVAMLALYRPDPYYPPVKHDLAWVLKTSRSSTCLRELRPLSRLA